MAAQEKIPSKNSSTGPKRLDFGVRRDHSLDVKPVKKPVLVPKSTPKLVPKSTPKLAHQPASKPVKPIKPTPNSTPNSTPKSAPKPTSSAHSKPLMPNRGHFIDFVPSRSKAPLVAPEPVSDRALEPISANTLEPISANTPEPIPADTSESIAIRTSVSHETIEISPAEEPRKARRPISPRGFMMDFMRRPKRHVAQAEKSEPEPELDSDFTPVSESHPRPTAAPRPISRPAPYPASRQSDSDFESELDSIDELSSADFNGLGDDIDAIEAEIEATAESETSDFIKAPKPLFEDPLVRLSKAREERQSRKKAAEEERLREEVLDEAREQAKRSPYAAMYNGDRSPFLTSVNVEKRPLSAGGAGSTINSAGASTSSRHSATSTKSSLFSSAKTKLHASTQRPAHSSSALAMKKQLADDAKEIHRQTMMMSTPETKSHKAALAIAVILTIILGAGVGAVIYLIFFQNN